MTRRRRNKFQRLNAKHHYHHLYPHFMKGLNIHKTLGSFSYRPTFLLQYCIERDYIFLTKCLLETHEFLQAQLTAATINKVLHFEKYLSSINLNCPAPLHLQLTTLHDSLRLRTLHTTEISTQWRQNLVYFEMLPKEVNYLIMRELFGDFSDQEFLYALALTLPTEEQIKHSQINCSHLDKALYCILDQTKQNLETLIKYHA